MMPLSTHDFPNAVLYATGVNVALWYDPPIGPQGIAILQPFFGMLDKAYADTKALFGIAGQQANCIVAKDGPLFTGRTDGSGGAYHHTPPEDWDIYVDVAYGNALVMLYLFIAELVESFENSQNSGWQASGSNGEALSRFGGQILTGGPTSLEVASVFPPTDGATWFNAGKPDWISRTEPTDTNDVSVGCGMVYFYWLMVTKGITPFSIIQAGCVPDGTLADNYATLRTIFPNRFPISGLTPYGDLIKQIGFIGSPPGQAITTDNPWRVVTWPSCTQCCGGPCNRFCQSGTTLPGHWGVTLSGFTDGAVCAQFSRVNGTYTMTGPTVTANSCLWAGGSNISGNIVSLGLSASNSGWLFSVLNFNNSVNSGTWQYSAPAFPNCGAAITFTNPVYFSSPNCNDSSSGHPASITITPLP